MSGKIEVINSTSGTVDVAINRWGDGDSDFYAIGPDNDSESWDRYDNRGFILVMTRGGGDRRDGTYWYVRGDATYVVKGQQSKLELTGPDLIQQLKNPFDRTS